MRNFDKSLLKKLYVPVSGSHKGQSGKLMVIGGSMLFHGASLWALKVASRIVDMVFYSSVEENLEVARRLKSELFDFIEVPRGSIEEYIKESDVVLLGPGLPRVSGLAEGEESTRDLTKRLLSQFPQKKWVLDAGALTEMDPEWLRQLEDNVILTPHQQEFLKLFEFKIQNSKLKITDQNSKVDEKLAQEMTREYNCVVLLKGEKDIVCSPQGCVQIEGGNAGMTKGGTGDVLAGLVAALATKNDLFLAATAGSYINKKAGESLFRKVGLYFNASDLVDEIPKVMKELFLPA